MFAPEQRAAICATIVERLALGEFVEDICADEGMPASRTVRDWLRDDDEFRQQCARAREDSATLIEREVAAVVRDVRAGAIDAKAANAALNGLTWLAKVRDRSRYGDKVEHAGKVEGGFALTIVRDAAATA